MLRMVLVFLLINGIIGSKPREHYCALSEDHTMCLYDRFDSMGLRCSQYHAIPQAHLKDYILKKHNSLRNDYASRAKPFSVPNMLGLEWDTELAEIAARWAIQCPYYEDDFRDVDRFKVAQAIGLVTSEQQVASLGNTWDVLISGNLTFHEAPENFNESRGDKLRCGLKLDLPLTLITNPYFKYVGCAASTYRQVVDEKRASRTILVCNYGPLEDSYDHSHPSGRPCTRCPPATKCESKSTYPNLCFDKNVE